MGALPARGTYAARADMQGLREVADAPDDRAREREPDKECPMKRSTFDGEAIVYRYGCPHWRTSTKPVCASCG